MSTEYCRQCGGDGSILDPDPYVDRRQYVICPSCAGRKTAPPSPAPATAPAPVTSGAQGRKSAEGAVLIPGVRFFGWDSIAGRHVAAIVEMPKTRSFMAGVYKRLVPSARQQMLLAKRWKVWGVLATDAWAFERRTRHDAP